MGPQGQQPEQLLLTTEPINTFAQICAIVRAYSLLAHRRAAPRVWKRGGCNVEDMQLRSREAMLKWAILHCAVAARSLRLSQLARSNPDLPALEESSPD